MTKKELEAYAALVLIKTAQICEPFSINWLKDKPDLQIGTFGIEVTEALDKKDGEKRHFDSKILNCETYEDANAYISNLKYPRKFCSETKQLPGSHRFSLRSSGGYDDNKPINLIVKAIKDKSRKFPMYPDPDRFTRRGLYISDQELRPCLQHLDIESILEATENSVFDVVFVHLPHKLFIFEKDNGVTKEYPFDQINRNDAVCEAKRVCSSPDYEICCERAKSYKESNDY